MTVIQSPSPNFNDRREALDMLVLHYTGMEDGKSALGRMCDPNIEVSAHYMIEEDGRIFQLVAEDKRAWHAGVSSWQGQTDLNSRSIGIEIVNGGHNVPMSDGRLPPFPTVQIDAVIALSKSIIERHNIPKTRIVGHSDIAPDRKEDPGEHFPWHRLSQAGVGFVPTHPESGQLMGKGLEPGMTGPPVTRLQESLKSIGYGIDVTGKYDVLTYHVVKAFQRRWYQSRVTGTADLVSLTLIERVSEAYNS